MLERFTERARRVLVLATEEARSRRHETVGPNICLWAFSATAVALPSLCCST
jgi:hypothetical protein